MSKELKEAGVAVFLAGGAEPICPPLPGLDSDNVIMSSDILIGAK